MKFFADLHLRPYLEKPDHTREMIGKSAELGYHAVGITFPVETKQTDIRGIRETCNSLGLDFVTRIDLTPKTPRGLLKNLGNLRREVEVVAVRCYSKGVARQAAKDRRVDLLSFPSSNPRNRFFDSAEAELASKAAAFLEVDMAPLLYLDGFRRIRLLTSLRKEVHTARKFGVPIVLSSGANDASLLRKPEDYAFLAYLFGLDFHKAKEALSETPRAIIERNRRKLSSDYVAPGVYMVRRGKGCRGV